MFPNPIPASCAHLTGSKANILIDKSGHACLADFSLLTIASDQSTVVVSCLEGGAIQWMSPELLYPERFNLVKSRPTEKSDCYAMGMVIYEVLSGQTPFSQSILSATIAKVLEGKRPERPEGEEGKSFTDAIWRLLELCWKHQPSDRANARAVLACLDDSGQPDGTSSSYGVYSCFTSATPLMILTVC